MYPVPLKAYSTGHYENPDIGYRKLQEIGCEQMQAATRQQYASICYVNRISWVFFASENPDDKPRTRIIILLTEPVSVISDLL